MEFVIDIPVFKRLNNSYNLFIHIFHEVKTIFLKTKKLSRKISDPVSLLVNSLQTGDYQNSYIVPREHFLMILKKS